MTYHAGMRRRKVPVLPSTPQGQTRASDGPVALVQGGSSARTAAEARENFDVPGLNTDNTFTGANTFEGDTTLEGDNYLPGTMLVQGTVAILAGYLKWGDVVGGNILQGAGTTDLRTWDLPDQSGTLAILGGPARWAYVAKTTNYTLNTTDCVCNVTSGSPTITLPTAVGVSGQTYIVKNSGAGTVTLATTSSQTIDGAAPGTIAAGNSLTVVSTGANWIIV